MKMLSIRQYAAKIQKSKPAVMTMIHEGKLPIGVIAQKIDNFYVIILQDLK
jgi:hypothetical protein